MHIDIPEDLHTRLRHLAQESWQDLDELLREVIEARLAVQERAADVSELAPRERSW